MLINTVVLVLRDMLPFAILLVWLKAFICPELTGLKSLIIAIILGGLGVILLSHAAPSISEWYQGAGFELLKSLLLIILVCSLIVCSVLSGRSDTKSPLSSILVISSVAILLAIKGANFLVYFGGYMTRSDNDMTLIIGVVLALGIMSSFCILYFFLLESIEQHGFIYVLHAGWAMFLAGRLAQIVPLLSQVDVISNDAPIWNSEMLIEDSSEYGHIANALVGYEATPSANFVLVYAAGIGLYIFAMLLSRYKQRKRLQKEGSHDK